MKRLSAVPRAQASGLTLIEILVALAVLGVILAMAVPSMSDLLERRRVIAAAEEVAGVLTYAKAETNAVNSILLVRFDPDPSMSCALVATAQNFSRCRCNYPANNLCPGTGQKALRLFQLPKTHVKFEASASNWGGTVNSIRFQRQQMTIGAEDFQVSVVGLRKGYTLRVEVNVLGRVKTCAPNGDMSGYGPCS